MQTVQAHSRQNATVHSTNKILNETTKYYLIKVSNQLEALRKKAKDTHLVSDLNLAVEDIDNAMIAMATRESRL